MGLIKRRKAGLADPVKIPESDVESFVSALIEQAALLVVVFSPALRKQRGNIKLFWKTFLGDRIFTR